MHSEKKESPWERSLSLGTQTSDDEFYRQNFSSKRKFSHISKDNAYLDLSTKRAAMKAADSVVCVVTYSDDTEIRQGCGTIIENDGIILTAAKVIKCLTTPNTVASNLKVMVYVFDGSSYEAQLIAHDFHFNLAILKIQSHIPFPAATLKLLDDCHSLDLSDQNKGFQLRPHTNRFSLAVGDPVIALGRFFVKPFDLMSAPGVFSINRCDTDHECAELFRADCKITRTGTGGPLINLLGEVIGVTFYDCWYTPFLPINVALKWWDHFKKYREIRRPLPGMQLANLYTVRLALMERVMKKLPNNFAGVVVEEIVEDSSAHLVGIRPNDVIVKCCGQTISSFLQLFEVMWDKTGSCVDLVIVRAAAEAPLNFSVLVEEATPENYYGWPK